MMRYAITPSRPFIKAVKLRLGASFASRVHERLGTELKLFPDPGIKALRMHLRECILPGLVLVRTLEENGYSQKDAIAILDEILEIRYASRRSIMELIGRIPGSYSLMRLLVPINTRMICPAEGWDTEWLENNRRAIRFNMHRCYYREVYTKLGLPELVASFCKADDFMYEGTSKSYEWRRRFTIGRGDDYCDFCFIRSNRHTIAKNRRES